MPDIDKNNGMWIRLTVCGVTRLGYGHAEGKTGGDAIKEVIGDALRNAAMRFGAALDLWHKGNLHATEDDDGNAAASAPPAQMQPTERRGPSAVDVACDSLSNADNLYQLMAIWKDLPKSVAGEKAVFAAKEAAKDRINDPDNAKLNPPADDMAGDEIQY
jgi:hypothetical protein